MVNYYYYHNYGTLVSVFKHKVTYIDISPM